MNCDMELYWCKNAVLERVVTYELLRSVHYSWSNGEVDEKPLLYLRSSIGSKWEIWHRTKVGDILLYKISNKKWRRVCQDVKDRLRNKIQWQ